ncbi:MAG: hypothetical protein PUG54_10510 [Firmicutes bacterium]|nr:hypothetical protein [Bacillota bacterium]
MEKVSENGQREVIRKQLLLNIAELLEKEGLLTEDEKDRMKAIIVSLG